MVSARRKGHGRRLRENPAGAEFTIPGYELAGRLGSGGSGQVYRARQPSFNRWVAVKVLSAAPGKRALAEFDRECQAVGALSGHPHIVTVYDRGALRDGRAFLVMELLEGSLGDRLLREGRLPVEAAVGIGTALAEALEAAHQAGVLHRDVKPENVLVSGFGTVKLGDFGIARIAGATVTDTLAVKGTFAHMAPELLDEGEPTRASDVYSLASTIFMLVHGEAPFVREGDTLPQTFARIAREPVPDLRPLGVPDPIAAALEGGLAKDPTSRPQTAAAFGQALQAAADDLGLVPSASLPPVVEAKPSAPDEPSPPPAPSDMTVVRPDPAVQEPTAQGGGSTQVSAPGGREAPPWWRGVPMMAMAGGLAAVVASVVGFGVRPWSRGSPPSTTTTVTSTTATTTPAPRIAFRDDFTRPASWPRATSEKVTTGFADGQYQMLVRDANKIYYRAAPAGTYTNVRIDAEAHRVSEAPGYLGLMCRDSRGANFDAFYVGKSAPNGFWQIVRYDGSGPGQTLASGRDPAGLDPAAPVHLTLECRGGSAPGPVVITLFVNGQQVVSREDPIGLGPGRVGVTVGTVDAEVDARFDNFIVTEL